MSGKQSQIPLQVKTRRKTADEAQLAVKATDQNKKQDKSGKAGKQKTIQEKAPEAQTEQTVEVTPPAATSSNTDNTQKMSDIKRTIASKALNNTLRKTTEPEFAELSQIEIEDRLALLEQQWKNFNEENDKLAEALDAEEHMNIYEEAEGNYLKAKAALRKRIVVPVMPQPETNKIEVTVKENVHDIPNTWSTFSGNPRLWRQFKEAFKIIHEHATLTSAQKFTYLSKALVGPAASVLGSGMDPTEANYNIVWSRLIERYEDDYRIVLQIFADMFNLVELPQASALGLRNILDTLGSAFNSLGTYFDVSTWEPLFVVLAIRLLDNVTLREWDKQLPQLRQSAEQASNAEQVAIVDENDQAKRQSGVPTWKMMETFLKQQAKLHQAAEASGYSQNKTRNASEKPPQNAQSLGKSVQNVIIGCHLCKDPTHKIFSCKRWLDEMTLKERKDYILEHNLCHVCLKPSHGSGNCYGNRPNKPCPACLTATRAKRYHNSTMCPTGDAARNAGASSMIALGNVGPETGAYSKVKKQ